jgi:hypothetical protein
MSHIFDGISQYTEQNATDLKRKFVLSPRFLKDNLVDLRPNLKGDTKLATISHSLNFNNGSCTTAQQSSATTISQINLNICARNAEAGWCFDELNDHFLRYSLSKGSQYNQTNLFGKYVEDIQADIAKEIGRAAWVGTVASEGCDGWFTQVAAASASTYNQSGLTINVASAYSEVNTAIANATSNVTDLFADGNDVRLFMNEPQFQILMMSWAAQGNYHVDVVDDGFARSFRIPGTRVTAEAVPELGSDTRMILTPAGPNGNLVFGTDAVSEASGGDFDFYLDKKDKKYYYYTPWKQGQGIFFPELISYIY